MDVSCKHWVLSQCLIDRISVRSWGREAGDGTHRLHLSCCLSYSLSCFFSFALPVTDNVGPFFPRKMCWCSRNCKVESLTPSFSFRKAVKLHTFWKKLSWFEFILLNHHVSCGSCNPLCASIIFCKVFPWFKKEYQQLACLIAFSAAFHLLP